MLQYFKERFVMLALLISAAGIAILYLLSQQQPRGHYGFKRRYKAFPVPTLQVPLGYNSYYLAGADSNSVLLGNVLAPLHAIQINLQTPDTVHIRISADTSFQAVKSRLTLLGSRFLMTDPQLHTVWAGSTQTWKCRKVTFKPGSPLTLDEYLPVSTSAVLFRAVQNQQFVIGLHKQGKQPLIFPSFLRKRGDPLFSSDGTMLYDQRTGRFAYVYFYQNQFTISDSILRHARSYPTLDTNGHAVVQARWIKSSRALKLSSAPVMINRLAALSAERLFIYSKIHADNDDPRRKDSHTAIDVYSATSGKYQHSFYLSDPGGTSIRGILVHENQLIILYERTLAVFSLPKT